MKIDGPERRKRRFGAPSEKAAEDSCEDVSRAGYRQGN